MPPVYENRILRVLKYVHEHPDGDLSLDALADVAAMSRFHWHRVFQAMTGETCAQAVRRVRMYRAASWLTHYDWPVSKVASHVGYPNVKSFSRVFTEGFGVSPNEFRKRGRFSRPLKQTSKGKFKMFEVEIDEVSSRRLAALMHRGPYTEAAACFEALKATATSLDLWSNKVKEMVGVHHDDPNVVAQADLRCHAGLVIPSDMAVPTGMEEVQLIGGKHAILHYKGPYSAIKVAYDYLYGEWLPSSGHEPVDAPSYELYLNDPADTAQDELLTDILLPLAS